MMIRITFTIILPSFFEPLFSSKNKNYPVVGETWFFSTRYCEILFTDREWTVVRTKTKPRIKIKTRDLIKIGHRVDNLWEIM